MEKSKTPTAQVQVFCDTYDMKLEAKLHTTDDGQKAKLTLETEDGKQELSVSLFKEDLELLASFLSNLAYHAMERPHQQT